MFVFPRILFVVPNPSYVLSVWLRTVCANDWEYAYFTDPWSFQGIEKQVVTFCPHVMVIANELAEDMTGPEVMLYLRRLEGGPADLRGVSSSYAYDAVKQNPTYKGYVLVYGHDLGPFLEAGILVNGTTGATAGSLTLKLKSISQQQTEWDLDLSSVVGHNAAMARRAFWSS